MYNEVIKNEYLENNALKSHKVALRKAFTISNEMENGLEKDMYDFNMDEMHLLFSKLSPNKVSLARNYFNALEGYIDWCICRAYRRSNINPFAVMESKWADQFVGQAEKIRTSEIGRYSGELTIGDGSYLEELSIRENKGMERLIFSKHIDSTVELEVVDINEDEYPIAVATIHFYNDKKNLLFDPVAETLTSPRDLEIKEKELGCDTASFEIIGKNRVSISTLADGYYGAAFESELGETLITFYVTHDSMKADELEEYILYALGL